VLEPVYWDAGTARLLPRLLKGRTRGPVFVTARRAGPGKVIGPRDVCPDTGAAHLSYALLDFHTATQGPGTGWDLHEYRHSVLTHLGEAGASLLMLMAKSRHRKPENLRRCFKPSPNSPALHPATHAEAAVRDRAGRPVDPDHPDRPETTEPWS
jgi:hypothetical protein